MGCDVKPEDVGQSDFFGTGTSLFMIPHMVSGFLVFPVLQVHADDFRGRGEATVNLSHYMP